MPASSSPRSAGQEARNADAAAPIALAAERSLTDVHDVFRRWLGDAYDLDAIHVTLAAAAIERLDGDPLWTLIVSGSGNAKTETVQALAGAGAIVASTITSDGALLSGSPTREKAKDATGGLLRKIGSRGLLVLKDVTSILSMNRDTRGAVLAALREIHDGRWERNVGTDGGRTLSWQGRIAIVGAVTTAWDRAHDVIASMGDRFVLLRMDSTVGRLHAGRQAVGNTGHEDTMRAELSAVAAEVLTRVSQCAAITVSDAERERILAAADVVTLARTGVDYDYRGDVIDAHAPEMPTRFAKQLTARRYAASQGWTVVDSHIYKDSALSGSSLERPGIQALLAAAARRPLPFDVLLVDDSSRVARDIADAVRILQQLKFFGVRVVYISQGIDSASEQAETLVAVHGMVDGLYLREMAAKIRRGLRGQLERGFATGSVTFGYRTVPVPDPSGRTDVNGYPVLLGKRVEIVPEEARIVVQIFEWCASGFGTGRIIERLNRDGRRGPRGARWKEGAVKRLLGNEKYRGLLVWGKKTFERRPGTRQYVQRPLPREQWHIQERPELRIVSDELWGRVQARRAAVRQTLPRDAARPLMRGRNAMLYSRHLFSGFMKCAECGGAIVTVTGGYGSPRYGCVRSHRNGLAACTNRLTIRAKIADAHLLAALKSELLAPATVKYITGALAAELNHQIDKRPRLVEEAETAREQATQRLQRLIEAIENGVPASTVASAIAERQAELTRLDVTLVELAEPLQQRLAVMPAWVRQQLGDLVALLTGTPERTKAEFQRLGMRVTMTPTIRENGRPYYQADVVNSLPCLAGITEMRDVSPSAVDRLDHVVTG